MITVPEATKKIVERSRYLSEALAKDLINLSSLARHIQPELEQMLIKKVSRGSIVMALKRLQKQLKPKTARGNVFTHPPQMLIRSGLFLLTIKRTSKTEELFTTLFLNRVKGTFSAIAIGNTEIQVSGSIGLLKTIQKEVSPHDSISLSENISQITIFLPPEARKTPGVYYFFLKSLAWEGINIVATTTTEAEFTLYFEDDTVNRAFSVLSSLFTRNVL